MAVDPDRITSGLANVIGRIAEAAERAGRDPASVTLIAVTKTFPVDVIAAAIAAGATDVGENRAQELREKVAVIGQKCRWHFIGNLQTNKVRFVVGEAALIHSVDRFGLAEAISRRAAGLGIVQEVLIEVNVSGEASKHGVAPAGVMHLAELVAGLPNIALRGVMTMAPLSGDPEASRPYFADLRELSGLLVQEHPDAAELSMGMSRDFEVAVEEGATLVRVGEAIFGRR